MDWCVGCSDKDFLLPKDDILSKVLMSESLLQWGRTDCESMESLSRYIVPEKTWNQEVHAGFSNHLIEQSGTTNLDDSFLSSLIDEGLPATESLNEPIRFSPEYQYSSVPTDDRLMGMVSDSRRVPSNLYGMKTDVFSPLPGGKMEQFSTSHSSPFTLGGDRDCPQVEAPMFKIHIPKTQCEVVSVEESVLQELGGVMAQLTQETRICFRDALYRLAKNSKQQHEIKEGHVEDFTDEMPRSGTGIAIEPESNAIDTAIGNLMFGKIEPNVQNLCPAMTAGTNCPGRDAEVPVNP